MLRTRFVPAVVAAGLLLGWAAPAAAEPGDVPETGVARADGTSRTLMLGGKATAVRGIELTVAGGTTVPVFSLAFGGVVPAGAAYHDATYAEAGVTTPRISGVLLLGYPSGDRADLIRNAGVKKPAATSEATFNHLLKLGTQAALWHFTNKVTLNPWRAGAGLGAQNEYLVVKKVYDYLVRESLDLPFPRREIEFVEHPYADAPPWIIYGPGGWISLEAENATVLRPDSVVPMTRIRTYEGFAVWSEKGGPVRVTARAPHAISPGEFFLADDGRAAGTPVTLAQGYGPEATATLELNLGAAGPLSSPTASPAPTTTSAAPAPVPGDNDGGTGGGLPVTGAPAAALLAGGLFLLVAGAAAALLVRRRPRFTS
ncbi:thioester domain-containing protein [Paractinoplanes lichenicola]|uniref:Thioester domain-containing protein n=1 Tax=Paractinoplanes lichenicola TaxID=2802976 RepID=A0ABS1VEV9_9ACTN|nr:thioester domain-containing protein [Actinoplanes lichenicola]MBL7252840.1 thioester domain-containing protein [Actinoplanes lichenicola]